MYFSQFPGLGNPRPRGERGKEREREKASSQGKGSNPDCPGGPTLTASSKPSHLPETTPPNVILALGVRVLTYEFGVNTNMDP